MKTKYVKTLLYSYRSFDDLQKRIDELLMNKALKSMTDYSACINQCEKMLNLTINKAIIFQAKRFVEVVLKRLDREDKKIIGYKYLKTVDKKVIDKLGLKGNAYYRKHQKILDEISLYFDWMGATDLWFENNCLKVSFFKKMYRSLVFEQAVRIKNPSARRKFYLDNVA